MPSVVKRGCVLFVEANLFQGNGRSLEELQSRRKVVLTYRIHAEVCNAG
jgi:hypothetical protein